MKYRPYDYQKTAMQWILDHPRCGLFLDMGLGKTVSTLTAVQQLMDDCEVSRTLVVAPKRWPKQHGLPRQKSGIICKA